MQEKRKTDISVDLFIHVFFSFFFIFSRKKSTYIPSSNYYLIDNVLLKFSIGTMPFPNYQNIVNVLSKVSKKIKMTLQSFQ
jgi:hypothetical protein